MDELANTDDETKGDALIGVKQPFPDAVARTVHEKLSEIVSVTDFGANGNDTIDMNDHHADSRGDAVVVACIEAVACVYTTRIPPVLINTKSVDEWLAERHVVLQGLLRALAEASTR